MDITKLDCPSCGATLKEFDGKACCEFCGREIIFESKTLENVNKTVASTIEKNSIITHDVIKSANETTQKELRRLQLTQEVTTLQMQISNLRSEKRWLEQTKNKTETQKKHLFQIEAEEQLVINRMNAIQKEQYQTQDGVLMESVIQPSIQQKSGSTVFFLASFLGIFGIHRFYTGHNGMGILYLFTGGVGGLGWLIDLGLIYFHKYKDANGLLLTPIGSFVKKFVAFWVVVIVLMMAIVSVDPNASSVIVLIAMGIALALVNIKTILKFFIGFTKKENY